MAKLRAPTTITRELIHEVARVVLPAEGGVDPTLERKVQLTVPAGVDFELLLLNDALAMVPVPGTDETAPKLEVVLLNAELLSQESMLAEIPAGVALQPFRIQAHQALLARVALNSTPLTIVCEYRAD